MFRRLFILLICTAAVFFGLKQYTADRAHRFILECLTAEEVNIIMDDSADPLAQDRIVNERWQCIYEKQSWVERIVLRALGPSVFD